jgi:DNA-binding transcriptional LysR family regulator
MEFEFLYDERHVVVAGAQSPWGRRRRIELAELVSEPWALPAPKSVSESVAMEAFRARGLDYPRSTVVTGGVQARMSLVAAGRFLSILPSALRFPAGQRDIRVLPVEPQIAEMPVGVVTLKNRMLAPVAQLFIDYAREVAKPLARRKT